MKRAFDANVSRAKPKIGLSHSLAGVLEVDPASAVPLAPPPPRELPQAHAAHRIAEQVVNERVAVVHFEPEPARTTEARFERAEAPAAEPEHVATTHTPSESVALAATPEVIERPVSAAPTASILPAPAEVPPVAALDAQARRERLKERLKRASEPMNVRDPLPATPAEAEAAALSMIGALQQALDTAEAQNTALRRDLEEVRGQLSRAANEARSRTEEAQTLAHEAGQRSRLMEDLTNELGALENERDDALQQLSQSRAEIAAQAHRIGELEASLAAKDKELLEAIAEEEHFALDLEARSGEVRTLRGLSASLTTERDALLQQVSTLTREREGLSDARKALESVHQALSAARSRAAVRR